MPKRSLPDEIRFHTVDSVPSRVTVRLTVLRFCFGSLGKEIKIELDALAHKRAEFSDHEINSKDLFGMGLLAMVQDDMEHLFCRR